MFSFKKILSLEIKIRPFLLFGIGLVLIAGIAISYIVYRAVEHSQQQYLLQRVSTIAATLNTSPIEHLRGDQVDLLSSSYLSLKSSFMNLHTTNLDTRFIYLMGQRDDTIFFYVDSESSQNILVYSLPGQRYNEANPAIRAMFENQVPTVVLTTDRWGDWVSGFAPVFNLTHSKVVAVIGMDISYVDYQNNILTYSIIPIIASLIFASLLFLLWLLSKREEEMLIVRAQILTIAAHDLRSPIISIKWAGEMLRTSKDQMSAAQIKTTQMIEATCEAVLESISELLHAASSTASAPKLHKTLSNLGDILGQSISPLTLSLSEHNIKLEIQEGVKTIQLMIDPERVRRVLTNIFSNAIKYSPKNSSITVSVLQQQGVVTIQIHDQGIGIPPSEQTKVFGGYFRASNARASSIKGNGVGLYYCKKVIEAHGGRIYLESQLDRGTTVFVEIPGVETSIRV